MSPLQVGLLLHYRIGATDYRDGDISAPAVREAIDWACRENLLEVSPIAPPPGHEAPKYRMTARGRCLVETICSVPLPQRREIWVTPEVSEKVHIY